ncbi:MAG: arginase [Armatimonadetes bacterium]|nr:arginase [Armatimonadota bacterium]
MMLPSRQRPLKLIGVPFDYCGRVYGSRLGPAAIRLAGLHEDLTSTGVQFEDANDLPIGPEISEEGGLRNFAPFMAMARKLSESVEAALDLDQCPIIFGGDHSIAIASVGAALKHTQGDLAVLWIDAHADLNTVASSASGNLHGMSLGVLTGRPSGVEGLADEQWKQLSSLFPIRLRRQNIAWIGLRDLDPFERDFLVETPNAYRITMQEVDRLGMPRVMDGLNAWLELTGCKNLWISFDVDALDPVYAPGTGTPSHGGLTYREAHLCAEMLFEFLHSPVCPYKLCGVDIVEDNPLQDNNNQTAQLAVQWLSSLMGKRIINSGTGKSR